MSGGSRVIEVTNHCGLALYSVASSLLYPSSLAVCVCVCVCLRSLLSNWTAICGMNGMSLTTSCCLFAVVGIMLPCDCCSFLIDMLLCNSLQGCVRHTHTHTHTHITHTHTHTHTHTRAHTHTHTHITHTHTHTHTHRWLDSSKTLYEQDVKEHDLLYLRFKYYSFMDIDPRVSPFSKN